MKIIIKNGTIINPDSRTNILDSNIIDEVYIKDGLVCSPFEADEQTKVIDATSKYVFPGLVDVHVHFRDPGYLNKEDIISGSKAAAAGGFTTVCCMPNTKPSVDSLETLMYIDNKGRQANLVNLLVTGAMTVNQAGKTLVDFGVLNEAQTVSNQLTGHGICGITEDGMTLKDKSLMKEICIIAKDLDLPVMDHPEPETQIVYRDIELSKVTGCRMHLQHISKAESIDLIRQAKKDGLKITAEATPHHFVLNKDAVNELGSNAKMNPPLATEKDRLSVLEGLADDTIDIIATDHAPHSEKEKDTEYSKAPNGIVGLETSFPLSYTELVKTGIMDINKLIYKMSLAPSRLIGLESVRIKVGDRADITIADINQEYTIDSSTFISKGKNTPFQGMNVFGKITNTILNGEEV